MRHPILAGAMAVALIVGGCGDDDGSPAGDGVTTTAPAEPGTTAAAAGSELDLCEVVDRSDVESIVTAASTDPDRITVEDRRPPLRGACAFYVENPGVGGSVVNLLVLDEFLFELDRENEDVDEVPGLGDEAFTFHGMSGRTLHVRSGDTYLSVDIGSYDDRMGLTEDSTRALAELVLSRL